MMRKLYSTSGTIVVILYLVVAGFLFKDAWCCVTMLCDLLVALWSMPTYFLFAALAHWLGWYEPGLAHADSFGVIGMILSLLGNAVLLYLLVFVLERLVKRIWIGIRSRSS